MFAPVHFGPVHFAPVHFPPGVDGDVQPVETRYTFYSSSIFPAEDRKDHERIVEQNNRIIMMAMQAFMEALDDG